MSIIYTILSLAVTGSIMIMLLRGLRPTLRKHLPQWTVYLLFVVVVLRLLIPFSPQFSLMQRVYDISAEQTQHAQQTQVPHDDGVIAPQDIVTPNTAQSQHNITIPVTENTPHQDIITGRQPLPWTAVLFAIWLTGALITFGRTVVSYALFLRSIRQNSRRIAVNGFNLLPIIVTDAVASPMLIGIVKPIILLPTDKLPEWQLRNALRHEAAHHRRGDILVKWATELCCSIYWFNPLMPMLRREMNEACERACDEYVTRDMTSIERKQYIRTLMESAAAQSGGCPLATAMTAGASRLKERLEDAMNYKRTTKSRLIIGIAAIIIFAAAGLSLGACTIAKTTSDDTSSSNAPTITSQSDINEGKESITLFSDFVAEKVNIEVRPNEYAGNAMFYVPDDEYQTQIIDLLQTLELQKVDSMLYLDEKLNYLGVVIWYNEEYWIVCDDGKLFAEIGDSFDWGVIDCPQLTDIVCSIAADELGLNLFFEPNQISNITSATLTCTSLNGVRYDNARFTVTDAKTLAEIEHMLSTAECLGYGGANCGFGNSLVLTTGEGKTITIGVSQDSCSSYMVDGKWYDFTAGYKDENTILYSLFGL